MEFLIIFNLTVLITQRRLDEEIRQLKLTE